MEKGMLDLHSVLRWVILLLLLLSIYRAYSGWKNKKIISAGDKKTWLFTLITAHTTLLVGIYLWLWGKFGMLKVPSPPEGVMKSKFYRFLWVEHPTFMLLAIIMITLGYRMSKKNLPDQLRYKRVFWLFIVALLFILVAIPWPFRDVIGQGRKWLPGM